MNDDLSRSQMPADWALQERIKELRLIYNLSDLAQDIETGVPDFLEQAVALLPAGWQYPADTCAAITFRGEVFATGNFLPTPWQQRSSIDVGGQEAGSVTVGYLSEHVEAAEGPFLAEERSLLDEVSRRMGRFIERKQALESLRRSEARYRGFFENAPLPIFEQDFSAVKRRIDQLRREGVTDFRALFESRPELVSECIALVKLLAFSRASLDLYGATTLADLQVGLERLVPLEARHLFVDELVWIAEGHTNFRWEGVNQKLTGELIDIRLHWVAQPGYEESLERVLVSIEDITDRKQAEAALQRSEARYRMVSELASDFAFTIHVGHDDRWHTEWVTDAFERITGYDPAEIDPHGGWLSLVHPDDKAAAGRAVRDLLEGIPAELEVRMLARDGRSRWVRLHIRPEWDARGQRIVRISGAGQDISEYKRGEP
jgi:PAS domain S-box-containing protein